MSPEVLERISFEAVEDCYREGTRRIEFRYAPLFVSEFSHLPWTEVLESFWRGMRRAQRAYPDIQVGLLCIASRDFGVDGVSQTVEFFLNHRDSFIGFDLAGNEEGNPCRKFESAFAPLRKSKTSITIHSGEACGPENIWEAIELLGAKRIGHGIAAVQDPKLIEYLRENEICLEQCPTSNWITRSVKDFASHPLPQLLRAGVPICINTDDPGIFNCTLPGELRIARTHFGLSESELGLCLKNAENYSFLR